MPQTSVLAVVLIFTAVPSLVVAGTADPRGSWTGELHEHCPSRHLEWLVEGVADDALTDFHKSLSPRSRRRIEALEDTKACARVDIGFGCMDHDYLRVVRRLGLMPRLVSFTCNHYRCEDVAMCDRVGLAPFESEGVSAAR
jgi:hypothetical protein